MWGVGCGVWAKFVLIAVFVEVVYVLNAALLLRPEDEKNSPAPDIALQGQCVAYRTQQITLAAGSHCAARGGGGRGRGGWQNASMPRVVRLFLCK